MTTQPRSRMTRLPILTVGLVIALAACGNAGASEPTTSTSMSTSTSSTAPETTTTMVATTTSTTAMDTSTTTQLALPSNAENYATAAFDAWQTGDLSRLRALTSDDAYQALSSRSPEAGDNWAAPSCDGAAGSLYCQWNGSNDNLVLRVDNQAASESAEQAVIEASFE